MFTLPRTKLSYCLLAVSAFVCWLLHSSSQVWTFLDCIGYQKKTSKFGLNNTCIKIMLNSCYPCAFYSFLEIYVMSIIVKYLYIISYSYNTPAILVCLFNLPLKDVPLPKKHFQEFVSLWGCIEGYDKWWCCIKLPIPTLCFAFNFERRMVELNNCVINCNFLVSILFNHSVGL